MVPNSDLELDKVFFRCVEDAFEPIMVTDRTGQLVYVNPAWSLTYGYSREEAIGETPRLLRSELQDEAFYKKMWATILDPQIGFWRGEVTNRARDGHLVPVLLTITPYRNSMGEILGYMGIAVDLTDQKRLEQQILQQDRLASIGLLAGGLAHEIGNPLGVIRGRAEMLQDLFISTATEQPLAAKNLDIILKQIDRISNLIRSLLRVSRVPEAVQLNPVDLESTVGEVVTLVSESCRKAEIQLRVGRLGHKIMAESSHLQQILLNLVLNSTHAIEEQRARGHSPILTEPGSTHFIEIAAEVTNQTDCALTISDSGCGIAPQNLQKLFQPFYTTKAAGKGTGLGLAIVSKLMDAMKGTIHVDSRGLGFGAQFTLTFKIATPEGPQTPKPNT